MRAQTASVVGIPSKTAWSTTATVRVEGREIFIAGGFSGDEQAPHDGRKLVRLIENLLQPDAQHLYELLEKFNRELSPSTAVSLAVLLKEEARTSLFCYGFGLAGLVRAGRGRWLADGSQEKVVLEGEIRAGDIFLLATARARELNLNLDNYTQSEPDDLAAGLFARVQMHPASGEIAVLSLKIANGSISDSQISLPSTPPDQKAAIAATPSVEEVIPTPSAATPQHLISPQKIASGIMASRDEQSSRIKNTLQRTSLFDSWRGLMSSRRTLLKLGIVLLVVFLLVLAMTLYRGASVARERSTVVQPLETMVTEILALPPEKIGEQRAGVQSLQERLAATRVVYGANRRRLQELITLVETKNQEISGEKELINLPVYYDFRLISANFLASKASREKNRAVFLDNSDNLLVGLNLDTKQNESYSREGLNAARDLVLLNSEAYVLQADSISSSRPNAANTTVLTKLADLEEPLLIDRFGESLYVLDRGGQQIWRVGTGEEASPSAWIRSARGIDFATVTSLSINGSIWLGTNDGNIFELVHGERQNFSVSGLVKPFTSTLLLATTEDGERLVVVEPAQKRLVVLNKNGEYQSQIESEQIGAVTDVFLSEDEKSLYLVAGSVIYRVEI